MCRFALVLLAFVSLAAADEKKEPKLSIDEALVIDLTNAERKKADLKPLKVNPQLMEAARKHAKNMAKQDKLDHVLDEKTPGDRAKDAGYKFGSLGENIAWNQKDAKAAVAGWMDSESHRGNIVSKEFTEIGVAMVKNEKGEPYWVQVFGKP